MTESPSEIRSRQDGDMSEGGKSCIVSLASASVHMPLSHESQLGRPSVER